MAGSLIFVIYQNAAGNDVTVSPRIATYVPENVEDARIEGSTDVDKERRGHTMPEFSDDFQITMLDGSGIKDNTMTANFKCTFTNPTFVKPR